MQLAAKSLTASLPGSKQVEDALRQFEKATCGFSLTSNSAKIPWQSSLARLIGHLQAFKLLQRGSSEGTSNGHSGQARSHHLYSKMYFTQSLLNAHSPGKIHETGLRILCYGRGEVRVHKLHFQFQNQKNLYAHTQSLISRP